MGFVWLTNVPLSGVIQGLDSAFRSVRERREYMRFDSGRWWVLWDLV